MLSCAGSQADARLSHAALADLLGEVDEAAIGRLPPPQREALDAMLLRSGSAAAGVDRRAVATAVLSVLGELGERGPVVIAIDDLQWLDRPSARVVEFCARRLAGPVGLIASRRLDEDEVGAQGPIGLREPERVEVCRLAPLDGAALGRLLSERAEQPLERRQLSRVQEASGGNPFYALELARALPAAGPPSPALPLPASLDEIVAARTAGLGEAVTDALLAVAVLAEPTVELLERALGPGVADRLDEAEERGVIERRGLRLRFVHPLFASGVYARAPAPRRRAIHRRLSAAVSDPEERARHLAHAGMAERFPGCPVGRPAGKRCCCSARSATRTTASPRRGTCSSRRRSRPPETSACCS